MNEFYKKPRNFSFFGKSNLTANLFRILALAFIFYCGAGVGFGGDLPEVPYDVLTAYPPLGSGVVTVPVTALQWNVIRNHTGYDNYAYTNKATAPDDDRLTDKEKAALLYPTGTSGYYNGTPTSIHAILEGNVLRFCGYPADPNIDYYYSNFYPNGFESLSFMFKPLNMNFHSFAQAGFLFNGALNEDFYTGYALILKNRGQIAQIADFQLVYINNQRIKSDNQFLSDYKRTVIGTYKTDIQTLTTPTFDVKIDRDVSTGAFRLYVDGALVADITDSQLLGNGNGFGFFTGHYPHGCPILSVIEFNYVNLSIDNFIVETAATVNFVDFITRKPIAEPQRLGAPGDPVYYGDYFKATPPPTLTYDEIEYEFMGGSIRNLDPILLVDEVDNEITLYYKRTPDSNLGDLEITKNASIAGEENNGTEEAPVHVNQNDTIDYSIVIETPQGYGMPLNGNDLNFNPAGFAFNNSNTIGATQPSGSINEFTLGSNGELIGKTSYQGPMSTPTNPSGLPVSLLSASIATLKELTGSFNVEIDYSLKINVAGGGTSVTLKKMYYIFAAGSLSDLATGTVKEISVTLNNSNREYNSGPLTEQFNNLTLSNEYLLTPFVFMHNTSQLADKSEYYGATVTIEFVVNEIRLTPLPLAKLTVSDLLPAGLSYVAGSQKITDGSGTVINQSTGALGAVAFSSTVSGGRDNLTWEFDKMPEGKSIFNFKAAVTSGQDLHENFAKFAEYDGSSYTSTSTYHSSNVIVTEKYQSYFDETTLKADEYLQMVSGSSYSLSQHSRGDVMTPNGSGGISTWRYYAWSDDDGATKTPGLPPMPLINSVAGGEEVILYFVKDVPLTIRYLDDDGLPIDDVFDYTAEISAVDPYYMPVSHLEPFDGYNYFGYKFNNGDDHSDPVEGAVPTSPNETFAVNDLLLASQADEGMVITLYFKQKPAVIVQYKEYGNEATILRSPNEIFIVEDDSFDPMAQPSIANAIAGGVYCVSNGKNYGVYRGWSLDGSVISEDDLTEIAIEDANRTLILYFSTQYVVTELFHSDDYDIESPTDALMPDVNNLVLGGGNFEGNPPETILDGTFIWEYSGYKWYNDNNPLIPLESIDPLYDPTIANLFSDITIIYIYTKTTSTDLVTIIERFREKDSTNNVLAPNVTQSVTYDDPYTLNPIPNIVDYVYVGWLLDDDNVIHTNTPPDGVAALENVTEPHTVTYLYKVYVAPALMDTFEIWNWADLAYLNVMLNETPQTEWASYGYAAKLMQNIGYPGDPNVGNGYNNTIGVTGEDLALASTAVQNAHKGIRAYGWYGYEGFGDNITLPLPLDWEEYTHANDAATYYTTYKSSPENGYGWQMKPTANGWIPIGGNSIENFNGTLDGQGYQIDSLWIDRPSGFDQGLFGNIENSTIKDLGVNILATGAVNAYVYIGGLVAEITGKGEITNCFVTGKVSGSMTVGGLVGSDNVINVGEGYIISDCYTNCEVIGTTGFGREIGGLMGVSYDNAFPTISNCRVMGNTIGNIITGGLVGSMYDGLITDCYVTGDVTGASAGGGIGGLVGECYYVEITNCHVSGEVIGGNADPVGGLLGFSNSVKITDCTVSGDVSGTDYVGGLVGYSDYAGTSITGSSTTGDVTGSSDYVGGLLGYAIPGAIITNCVAEGAVSGLNYVGGLTGYTENAIISNSYASGAVEGEYNIGGLAGYAHETEISNSYASGDVTAESGTVGGLAGYAHKTEIANCYAIGAVEGTYNVGGLVGSAEGEFEGNSKISNSYASGDVTAEGGSEVGGLVGYAYETEITHSYASGTVKGDDYIGGLAGSAYGEPDGNSKITNCFALNPKIIASSGTEIGRIVGYCENDEWNETELANNQALSCMLVKRRLISNGKTNDKNGASIPISALIQAPLNDTTYTNNGWDFATVWTFNYEHGNPATKYNVTENTNLPILQAFDTTANSGFFADAVQPPSAECKGTFKIWNWADLAYLNVLIENQYLYEEAKDLGTPEIYSGDPKLSDYDVFLLMQDIGIPDSTETYGKGDDCPYDGERKLGWYGYNNWATSASYDGSVIDTAALIVGGSGTTGIDTIPADPAELPWVDEEGWVPVGEDEYSPFTGIFDGQGFSVTGLWIDRTDDDGSGYDQGLFGYVKGWDYTEPGIIKNLGVNIIDSVKGYGRVGGLVGNTEALEITNCYATGNVSGEDYQIGGLIGYIVGTEITNCYATGNVSGDYAIGGLVGFGDHIKIFNSYATGEVSGNYYVGGLIGGKEHGDPDIINNCYATGNVTAHNDDAQYVGGLVGYTMAMDISNCYATGNVTVQNDDAQYVGGLVGYMGYSTITNSYATGSITVKDGDMIGGLVGMMSSPTFITNCYATGSITVKNGDTIGGLVGFAEGYDEDDVKITNSFAFNPQITVPATADSIGRIVGSIESFFEGGATLENNYALANCVSPFNGTPAHDNKDGEDISIIQATNKITNFYTTAINLDAWDFDDVWTFDYDYLDQSVYRVTEHTNLPILQAFNTTDFPKAGTAVQPPFVAQYDVVYHDDYGNGLVPPTVSYCVGNMVTVQSQGTLSRASYNFLGWALSASALAPDYVNPDEFPIYSDTDLYAVWARNAACGRFTGSISIVSRPSCDGVTPGSVYVDITGGVGPYYYDIIGDNGYKDDGEFPKDSIISDLPAGNYTLMITDDGNDDCENILPTFSLVSDEVQTVVTNITTTPANACGKSGNGTVTVTVAGATDYTYLIEHECDTIIHTTLSETELSFTYSPLPTGEYQLTIFDTDGCRAPGGKFTIDVAKGPFPTFALTEIPGDCTDPEGFIAIKLDVSNTYSYSLDEGGWIEFTSDSIAVPATVGFHSIRLKTSAGCISTADTITLTQNNNNAFTAKVTGTTSTSCGVNNGSIYLKISPSGTYNYHLTDSLFGLYGTFTTKSDGTYRIENLPAGLYVVTIDNEGHKTGSDCAYHFTNDNVEVRQGLKDLLIAAPSATTPQTFCFGATIDNLQVDGTGIKWYNAADDLMTSDSVLYHGAIYYAAQTTSGGCESAERAAVKVIIDTILINDPGVASEITLCLPATLADIPTNGNTNIFWYDDPTDGGSVPLDTDLTKDTTFYYATLSGGGSCESIQRKAVHIVVVSIPPDPPTIESPQHFCDGALVANLVTPNNQILWYDANNNLLPNDAKLVTGTYFAIQKAGNCQSAVSDAVEVIIDRYSAPVAPTSQTLCGGKIKTVADLTITGAGIKWYDKDYQLITNPSTATLTAGDSLFATQSTGDCEGDSIIIHITKDCFSPYGTVFPFVHTDDPVYDSLFTTTAKLYALPPAAAADKIGYVRKQTPLYMEIVTFYDSNFDTIPEAPKIPGIMGNTDNPGLPIRWTDNGYPDPGTPDETTLAEAGDNEPTANIGKYRFKDVAPGQYVIEIARKGFLTRYGLITVTGNDYLGHREILAGDVNGDLVIDGKDLSTIRQSIAALGTSQYNYVYDFHGLFSVTASDVKLIQVNLNFHFDVYQEAKDWANP